MFLRLIATIPQGYSSEQVRHYGLKDDFIKVVINKTHIVSITSISNEFDWKDSWNKPMNGFIKKPSEHFANLSLITTINNEQFVVAAPIEKIKL